MKLTENITDLLLDLTELETPENTQLLIGDGTNLRNNLLKLYRATENQSSHQVITQILSEAGYPWFDKLAKAGSDQGLDAVDAASLLSEDEFMQLVPPNGYFH